MTTSIELRPRATRVFVTDETLTVELADGRSLTVPLGWFPRLSGATLEERADWRLMGDGAGIHWEQIDEDISVSRLLGLPTD